METIGPWALLSFGYSRSSWDLTGMRENHLEMTKGYWCMQCNVVAFRALLKRLFVDTLLDPQTTWQSDRRRNTVTLTCFHGGAFIVIPTQHHGTDGRNLCLKKAMKMLEKNSKTKMEKFSMIGGRN